MQTNSIQHFADRQTW